MDTREFPVLTEEDNELINRLAAAIGDDEARVLAYLLLREKEFTNEPATRHAVRIGTSLNQETVSAALNLLEKKDLVVVTTIQNQTRGRPPKAWQIADMELMLQHVYEQHSRSLLEQASSVATVLGATHCEESAGRQNEDSVSTQIRLGLNWRPNPLHAPFFAAIADDNYDDNGVTVTIQQHDGSKHALESLVSGVTDVTLAGAATVLRAFEREKQVVPLALLFQRAMTVLYTTRDAFGERFENTEQLRGCRIGMSRNSEMRVLSWLLLSQAGVLDDVTIIDVEGEEQEVLQSGDVDVVTGSFSDPERMRTSGFTVDELCVAEQFPMYGLGILTTEQALCERRSTLARFLVGTIAGWAEATQQPESAVSAIDSCTDREYDYRMFERAVEEFGTSAAVREHGWGWHQVEGWQRLRTALDQGGLLTESV